MEKRIRKMVMRQVVLGKVSSSYKSNIYSKPISKEEFDIFIEELQEGPQIVTMPVPPYRHAFLIDVDTKEDKIKISDWNGCITNDVSSEWILYSKLINTLKKKYKHFDTEYYEIDADIYLKAKMKHSECNGGGCSYYIYEWIKKYYPEYK